MIIINIQHPQVIDRKRSAAREKNKTRKDREKKLETTNNPTFMQKGKLNKYAHTFFCWAKLKHKNLVQMRKIQYGKYQSV